MNAPKWARHITAIALFILKSLDIYYHYVDGSWSNIYYEQKRRISRYIDRQSNKAMGMMKGDESEERLKKG